MATDGDNNGLASTHPEIDDEPTISNRYLLNVEEFDGRDVFYSTGTFMTPSIIFELTESDMDVPILSILTTYITEYLLRVADGHRHLYLAGTNVRAKLEDPVRTIFGTNKEVTLFVHLFGPQIILPRRESEGEDKDELAELQQRTEKLKEVLAIPGFLNSENGSKLQRWMEEIDKEVKAPRAPDYLELQQKLSVLNEIMDTALNEYRSRTTTVVPAGRNYVHYIAYGALIVIVLVSFLFRD